MRPRPKRWWPRCARCSSGSAWAGGGKGGGELTIGQIAPLLVQMGAPVQVASRCPEWGELAPIVAQAAAACRAARQREGEALRRDLVARFVALRVATERIARVAPDRVARERDRLAANVARLTGLAEVDAGRLAQEVAIAADRLDVHEELVRLAAHLQAAEQALGGEQPAGKALGFLAQEIGRELNTIGAKASDAVIGREVVAMKGELEKVREQVENLE